MRQLAAHHVVGIQVADHPAAAVEKHQAWRKAVGLPQDFRCVDASRDRTMRRGDRNRFDRFKFRRFRIGDKATLQIQLARLGRRHRFVGRPAGFLKCLEHGGGIGIEGNGHRAKTSDVRTLIKISVVIPERPRGPRTTGYLATLSRGLIAQIVVKKCRAYNLAMLRQAMATSPSISTGIPKGSSAIPTALRAWAPASGP